MYLLDIIPLAKIPHTLPQILSYFSGQKLPAGALVQIPLGRRKESGIVIGARNIADSKMEIKNADFELRNISKIISAEPVLTAKQIELAMFLGQYYFCSPGIFAKMCLPKSVNNKQLVISDKRDSFTKNHQLKTKNCRLILVPTISQSYSSHKSYPSNSVLWHSELTQKQKNAARLAVKTGQTKLGHSQTQTIIGTRSAVFLPFDNLKEIIIEDETNPNHKSWDMFPHYDTHITAQKIAELFNAKLTIKNIFSAGLKTKNYQLPTVVDMREELKGGNFSIFSVDLYEAVKNALAAKKQIILFINRRGLANFILCRDCGYIAKCGSCDAPLAHHIINNRPSLLCHHCGAKDVSPKNCPKCKSWRIKTVGSGSQKVEIETQKFFPDAKILRLDGDIAPKPKDQQKIIADFTEKKADILIATQIIFSWLAELTPTQPAVVGILSADTLLHIPDFRSSERTFQTIRALQSLQNNAPVKGVRYSKFKIPDTLCKDISAPLTQREVGGGYRPPYAKGGWGVFIQTYNPDNSVLKYVKNNDHAGFIKEDMAARQALNYPPFSQIVKLTFRHRDPAKAWQEAKILAAKLNGIISSPPQTRGRLRGGDENIYNTTSPQSSPQLRRGSENNIELSPALPAFLPRERGKYVWNIILKFLPTESPSPFEGEGWGEVNLSPLRKRKSGGVSPLFRKEGLGRQEPKEEIYYPPYAKGGSGGYISPDFLSFRNSLLQYVPAGWEIDVDPENLL